MELSYAHILADSFIELFPILPCSLASGSEEKHSLLFQSTVKHVWMTRSIEMEICLETNTHMCTTVTTFASSEIVPCQLLKGENTLLHPFYSSAFITDDMFGLKSLEH